MDPLDEIRVVRTVGRLVEERWSAEEEVNAALARGWRLLLVQAGPERPIFVLGWPGEGPPARTPREEEEHARAAVPAPELELGEPLSGPFLAGPSR